MRILFCLTMFFAILVFAGCNSKQIAEGGKSAHEKKGKARQMPKKPTDEVASSEETVRIGAIDWLVSYEKALAKAKMENKPIWLHFGENPG